MGEGKEDLMTESAPKHLSKILEEEERAWMAANGTFVVVYR